MGVLLGLELALTKLCFWYVGIPMFSVWGLESILRWSYYEEPLVKLVAYEFYKSFDYSFLAATPTL